MLVKWLPHYIGMPSIKDFNPEYSSFLLRAAINDGYEVVKPGKKFSIQTGLAFELPQGTEAQIRPLKSQFKALLKLNGLSWLDDRFIVEHTYVSEFEYDEVIIDVFNSTNDSLTIYREDIVGYVVIYSVLKFKDIFSSQSLFGKE